MMEDRMSEMHETVSAEKFLSLMAWENGTVLVSVGQGDGEEAEEVKVNIDDAIAALQTIKSSKALVRISLSHQPGEPRSR